MAVPYPDSDYVAYDYEPRSSYPPFQPAPSRYEPPPVMPVYDAPLRKPGPRKFNSIVMFNLVVGVIMLSILILLPVWASVRLLYDQTFVFFVGRDFPFYVIVTCVSVVVSFVLVVLLLVSCGKRDEARSQSTFLATFMVFVTALGLALLLLAIPLRTACDDVFQDLTLTCQDGARTAGLYRYYHALLQLRQQPDCINAPTVEICKGYQETQPYTGFLKYLEGEYLCSGFCYDADHPFLADTKASGKNSTDVASLFQKQAHLTSRNKLASMLHNLASDEHAAASQQLGGAKSLLQNSMRHTARKANATESAGVKYEPVRSADYPPTLFNTANYQASCDGMASRAIRYKALDIAENQYLAGVFMLVGAIVAGVLRLSELCREMGPRTKQLAFQA